MELTITLRNYRCFTDDQRASFVLGEGLTSFIGVNNSGKSAVLRFFFEFRQLLGTFSNHPFSGRPSQLAPLHLDQCPQQWGIPSSYSPT